MERDLDLVRGMLLGVEKAGTPTEIMALGLEETDFQVLAYHAQILVEAGLLKARITWVDNSDLPVSVVVERLTWEGHDYLDAVRDDGIWVKTRALVRERAGVAALEVVKSVAIAIAKAQLGL